MPCALFPWQTQTQALLDLAHMQDGLEPQNLILDCGGPCMWHWFSTWKMSPFWGVIKGDLFDKFLHSKDCTRAAIGFCVSRDVSGLARRKWSRWSMRLPESSKFAILLQEFAWVSLWFEPFRRWGSWNPTLYLSLNSSLLFLSDWLPPSLLSGHGSGKEKESS